MKFKKYIRESVTEEFENPFSPPITIKEIVDSYFRDLDDMIAAGDYEGAKAEIDAIEKQYQEEVEANRKKKFFKWPEFILKKEGELIDVMKQRVADMKKNESIEDMDKRCENCNTLLNDQGTCPKCHEGEEDYGDKDEELNEDLSNREKLLRAYPELDFSHATTEEGNLTEELSVREKLLAAYPELNFDNRDVNESCVKEELSNREKLQRAFPELNFDKTVEESVEEDPYKDYDDDYDIEDDVEMDRRHAALYGGERMYCSCGKKLSFDEQGSYCPDCDPKDFEEM